MAKKKPDNKPRLNKEERKAAVDAELAKRASEAKEEPKPADSAENPVLLKETTDALAAIQAETTKTDEAPETVEIAEEPTKETEPIEGDPANPDAEPGEPAEAAKAETPAKKTGKSKKASKAKTEKPVEFVAYCGACGTGLEGDGKGGITTYNCPECGIAFQDSISCPNGHELVYAEKPGKCSVCQAELQTQSAETASSGVSATVNGDILTYEAPGIPRFTASISKAKELATKDKKALDTDISLSCRADCPTGELWSPKAAWIVDCAEKVQAGEWIPVLYAVHPKHRDCYRKNQIERLISSAKAEPFTPPKDDAERNKRRDHAWKIEDGRVFYDDGRPGHSFSFDLAEAKANFKDLVHVYECAGPHCDWPLTVRADKAIQQAEAAKAGKRFYTLPSFPEGHDRCKSEAIELERASKPKPDEKPKPKTETPAEPVAKTEPKTETPAEPVAKTEPAVKVAEESKPAAKTEPVPTAQSTVATPAAAMPAPVVPTEGETGLMAGIGQLLAGVGALLNANQADVSGAIRASAEVAEASQKGTEALGDVARTQSEQLGSLGKSAQDGLNRVTEQLLRERGQQTPVPTATEIAQAIRITEPGIQGVIKGGGTDEPTEANAESAEPVGKSPAEKVGRK